MISQNDLIKIKEFLWEIPRGLRKDMRVPARFYSNEKMLAEVFKDESLQQLVNLTAMPGIKKYSLAMPDIHEGYGSPIGGVFAVDDEEGVISPGAVGYDINCGVRLLLSPFSHEEIKKEISGLAEKIYRKVPSGLGRGQEKKISAADLDNILQNGAKAFLRQGYATSEDIENCEENGGLALAEADNVSSTAKARGGNQLGTLGSGNHFLEIQKVEEIFDEKAARAFGLFPEQVVIMIHTGSRGLGHQVATDYIRLMMKAMPKYNLHLPDKELASAPIVSDEGKMYFGAMAAAANFAWANRQMISFLIREAWGESIGKGELKLLYDVAHNIAKQEGGLIVHRKGATRAFAPGSEDIPEKYRSVGQPVLIPGSMGTSSYVLAGTKEAEESFYSTCHGAGRRMSRHQATRTLSGQRVAEELGEKGIIIKTRSLRGVSEEAPEAYKDVDEVVGVVDSAGLSKKVARLLPLAVIKGE